ncbi:MAG: hypothetical protein PHQ01_04250 [Candidatus Pacebacteria bacterium]|nr:hypothetical protein [Candidatus Paceibacterota bacterium]
MKKTTLNLKNTPTKGIARIIQFKDGDKWYSVCLEFNIVEVSVNREKSFGNLIEAVEGYVEAARKIKGLHDFSFLNQTPIKEYEYMWRLSMNKDVSKFKADKNLGSLKSPFFAGYFNLAHAK